MDDSENAGAIASAVPLTPTRVPRQIRLVALVFLAALLVLVGIATLAYFDSLKNADNDRWVDHTYEVIVTTEQVFSDERGAAATARGYLLTGDPKFTQGYATFRDAIAGELDALAALVVDNPDEVARVADLRRGNDSLLRQLADMVQMRDQGAPKQGAGLTALVTDSNQTMARLRAAAARMETAESRLLTLRRDDAVRGERLTLMTMLSGVSLSLVVLLVCLWLLTREVATRRRAETQVRRLNEQLATRNAALEASNRELEGFSYSISHDLRSPLRAIDGFSQLLQNRYAGILDPEAMRLLGVVRENGQRMSALIDDLLAFSRMGRKPIETGMLDMPALVGECIAEVLRGSPQRPILVVGPLPNCRGDRTLLHQVWTNLIGNAVKYSGQNRQARVEITGREEGLECIYSVRDNGVGFDMQYYHKLFGVFQRLHQAEEFPGTGVGLAIAMRAVTKHGGRLWVDAVPGRGATFLFSLPRTEST
ncbi:MAG TPA: CHASE3 domain-containing protein [Gammaproteobacteria bacterium]|jgi:signal transduction histidine kinase